MVVELLLCGWLADDGGAYLSLFMIKDPKIFLVIHSFVVRSFQK